METFLVILAHLISPYQNTSLFSIYPSNRGPHINSELQIILLPFFFFKYYLKNHLHTRKINFSSSAIQDDSFQSSHYQGLKCEGHLLSRSFPWEQQMLLSGFHCNIFSFLKDSDFSVQKGILSFFRTCIFCENDVLWELF